MLESRWDIQYKAQRGDGMGDNFFFFETTKCFIWSLRNCNSGDTVSSKPESVSRKTEDQKLIKAKVVKAVRIMTSPDTKQKYLSLTECIYLRGVNMS